MKRILLTTIALVLLVGCAKQETQSPMPEDNPQTIVFGSSIDTEVTHKAPGNNQFTTGDQIGVLGYRTDRVGDAMDKANPFLNLKDFTFATTNGGEFTSTSVASWLVGKAHNFYAYYPPSLSVTPTASDANATITVTRGTGIAHDVMTASSMATAIYNGTVKTADLRFTHRLSRVRFRIVREATAPAEQLTKVEFNMASKAGTIDVFTGNVSKRAGSVTLGGDITPLTISSVEQDVPGEWTVMPGDMLSDMVFTVGGKMMKMVGAGSTLTTNQGRISLITIKVKGPNFIVCESSIIPWSTKDVIKDEHEPSAKSIAEFGVAPFDKKGAITTSTPYSYNTRFGEGSTNGQYRTDVAIFARERPFNKFEIALTDATDIPGTWRNLQSTTLANNICVKKHGTGWRIPRMSELRLIYENRDELETVVNGFVPLVNAFYWSSTESSSSQSWSLDFSLGSNSAKDKNELCRVRCVKEAQQALPPPPVIGDYYYNDDSYSATYDAGKTLVGVVYRVNSDGTGMIVEVGEGKGFAFRTDGGNVDSGAKDPDNGLTNLAKIKTFTDGNLTNFPAFKYCEDKNGGGAYIWYLPAKNELKALYAGYCGLRWMRSGANMSKGEINKWTSGRAMPNYGDYATHRTKINNILQAAGGTPFTNAATMFFWSSSEVRYGNGTATRVQFNEGMSDTQPKSVNSSVRCVRAF